MSELNLPKTVTEVSVDGKNIYIVGTAHVSKQSVEDVQKTVEAVNPDSICIELCENRYKSQTNPELWNNTDIFQVVKQGKALFLFVRLLMSSFYKRLGDQLEVKPGAEFTEGARLAHERGKELVLADRDIEVTLKRVWGHLGFWSKLKMASQLFGSVFVDEEDIDKDTIENLKEKDQLEHAMEEFAKQFPEVKRRLIDERDIYLAQKVREAKGYSIVAVVGAGHVPGMIEHIQHDNDLKAITEIPPKSSWPKIVGWTIPVLIIGLFVYLLVTGDYETAKESAYIWFAVNGILSGLGAIIALGHPITVITAVVAAPLTSLNPMIGAGTVAGLVQAFVRKPTVKDMEEVPEIISTFSGFWKNAATRVLLVFFFSSLGSGIGSWLAGTWIVKLVA